MLYPLQRNDPTIWIDWSVLTKTTREEPNRCAASTSENTQTHTHTGSLAATEQGCETRVESNQIRPRPRDADRAAYLLEKTERYWVSISSRQLKSRALRADTGKTIAHDRSRVPTIANERRSLFGSRTRVGVDCVCPSVCVCVCELGREHVERMGDKVCSKTRPSSQDYRSNGHEWNWAISQVAKRDLATIYALAVVVVIVGAIWQLDTNRHSQCLNFPLKHLHSTGLIAQLQDRLHEFRFMSAIEKLRYG